MQMENFLDSSILPGDSLAKHEHRRMFVILIIIVVIAVAVLVGLLVYSRDSNRATTTEPVRTIDPKVVEINNYKSTLTDQQKSQATTEIQNYKSSLTEAEKAAKIQEIINYSIKK